MIGTPTQAQKPAYFPYPLEVERNNLVENYYIWLKGDDLTEKSVSEFAGAFTKSECKKPCNLYFYDKKLSKSLVTMYPLRGADYIEVADHLVAAQIFEAPGQVHMWGLKNDRAAYEQAKSEAAAGSQQR